MISIEYRRLPNRLEVFRQELVVETPDCSVTYLPAATIRRPLIVHETAVLLPGSPIVWFTFPGRWYDIGRFHLPDGTFTGFYANVLTPVRMLSNTWETTDLCLDVWHGADGTIQELDRDEFDEATRNGWMDGETARRADQTAVGIADWARSGWWPPGPVAEWPLARVRATLGG